MPNGGNAMLWQRFTFAESSAFNKILGTFWHEKDANLGKLPVVEYKGSKPIQVGMGTSSELSFVFSKWGDRGFNVPEWYVDPDAPADDEVIVALGASIGGNPHHRIGDRYQDLEEMGRSVDNPAGV